MLPLGPTPPALPPLLLLLLLLLLPLLDCDDMPPLAVDANFAKELLLPLLLLALPDDADEDGVLLFELEEETRLPPLEKPAKVEDDNMVLLLPLPLEEEE